LIPRRTLWLAGQPFSCTPSARAASARLPFGDLAGVADADRRDERDAVDVLDDALDLGDQIVR
jgi:hypothetical protein